MHGGDDESTGKSSIVCNSGRKVLASFAEFGDIRAAIEGTALPDDITTPLNAFVLLSPVRHAANPDLHETAWDNCVDRGVLDPHKRPTSLLSV